MLDVRAVLIELSSERPIFHSEFDFQHALAWMIHQKTPAARVRLEVPSGRIDKRERIDIIVYDDDAGLEHAIELKFRKGRLNYHLGDEHFLLADGVAHDSGRYDYIKDIARLEAYVAGDPRRKGHAIFLSNDRKYWEPTSRKNNSKEFFIHEGRKLIAAEPMSWGRDASDGTRRRRESDLSLLSNREIIWNEYYTIPGAENGRFRFVHLEI